MTSLSVSERSAQIYQTLCNNPILRPQGDRFALLPASDISLDEISKIVLFIDKYKDSYIQIAQIHPERTVFVRPANSLLDRTIQFCAKGIFIHLNRRNDFKDERFSSNVYAAIRVDSTPQIFMVATAKLIGEHSLYAQRDQEMGNRLKGQEGIVEYFDSYVVTNKDIKKSYSFRKFYNRADLFSFNHYNFGGSFDNKCKIALDILRGLNSLSKNGIIHRNINIQHIFIEESQGIISAHIGDLGFAVSKDNVGDEYVGDVMYMAPEICMDPSSYSHASDCWAAGIVIAEIFHSVIPWRNEGFREAIDTIASLNENPFPVHRNLIHLKVPTEFLIQDLCELDSKKRISSIDAFANFEFEIQSGDLSLLKDIETLKSVVLGNTKGFNGANKFFHKMASTMPLSFNFRTAPVALEEFESILLKYTHIASITLPENANDNYLKLISEHCPHLKRLILSNCYRITDSGLEYLSTMTSLEVLDISESLVSDSGIEYLSGLVALQDLNMSGCGDITDDALASISNLTLLKKLNLRDCHNITGEGLQNLSNMSQLEWLDISQCEEMTIEGLYHVEALPKLNELFVADCPQIEENELRQFLDGAMIAHVCTEETVTLTTLDGTDCTAYL